VKLVKFLRETYVGDEHLIIDNNVYKRLKILKPEAIGNKMHELTTFLALFSLLKHPSILVPEGYDLREVPKIYLPYLEGRPINLTDKAERENFALFLFGLLRELLHLGIAIPVISVEDFLISENFFMLPPCWFNSEVLPKGEYVFVAPEFLKEGKSSIASTVYVFGKLIDSLTDRKELKELVIDFTAQDPAKRKTHFPVALHLLQGKISPTGLMGLRLTTVHRQEEEEVIKVIRSNEKSLNTILVYGPQRVGKTTLLSLLSDELRNEGIPVIWATDLQALVIGLLQFVDDSILSRLDEQDRKKIEDLTKSGRINASKVVLTVGKILSNLDPIVIIVDDAHEMDLSLKAVLEQLQSYKFSKGHTLLLASYQRQISLSHDVSVELKPFDFEKTAEMISTMIMARQENIDELAKWAYVVTQGLPGQIVELMRTLIKNNALRLDKDKIVVDQEILKRTNLIEIVKPTLNQMAEWGAHLIAVCGERFETSEFEALISISSLSSQRMNEYLSTLVDSGLLYWENGKYRFAFFEIWRSLYDLIEPEVRVELHTNLSLHLREPSKKAWHLKMLGQKVSAAVLYLLTAKKELENYRDVTTAISMIEEAEKLLENRDSYALNSLKLRALQIKQDSNALERFALSLSKKYNFLIYSALIHASKANLAKEMEQEEDLFKARTAYSKLTKLCCKMRRMLISGEKISQGLMQEVEILLARLKDIPPHRKLKALTLLLIAQHTRISRVRDLDLLNQAKQIAESNGFLDILAIILNEMGTRMAASPEAERLFENVIEIAHRIGSEGLAMTALSNMIWTNLYRGNVQQMFQDLGRLRQLVSLTGNIQLEAYSYFVEANYHMYNRELNEALEDLSREFSIERYLGIEERAFRGIVCAYALAEDVEKARRVILENIENPAVSSRTFAPFRDLFLAENDEEFLQAWQRFLKKDTPYWSEEACQIFAQRLIKCDREGFIKFARKLELDAIKSGAFLSLAQIYESLALGYKAIEATPLAINYAERAISIYQTRSFVNAAVWLEKKIEFSSDKDLIERLNELKLNVEASFRQPLAAIEEQVERTMRNSVFLQHVIDILKVTNPQEEVHTTLEFLVSKMMNLLPILSAAIIVMDSRGKVLESVSLNIKEIPKETKVSYEPFEMRTEIEIYDGFKVLLYVANQSLYMDQITGYQLVKSVLNLQEVIVYTLKNIIAYHRSVTDPLTGLHTRWYFITRLHEEFERSKRYNDSFSVIMADIDDFKKINDTYGHRIGDEVLKFIASVLRSSTRASDIVGRYGGEEFIVILPSTTKENAAKVAEKILYQIVETNPFEFRVTMSFGVSGYPQDDILEPEDLIALADKATYVSKERGKACVTIVS